MTEPALFNPFFGAPNHTGYTRPPRPKNYAPSTVSHLTEEQLEQISRPPEPSLDEQFQKYAAGVAMDALRRATKAETLREFIAYRRTYKALNDALINAQYWPEE